MGLLLECIRECNSKRSKFYEISNMKLSSSSRNNQSLYPHRIVQNCWLVEQEVLENDKRRLDFNSMNNDSIMNNIKSDESFKFRNIHCIIHCMKYPFLINIASENVLNISHHRTRVSNKILHQKIIEHFLNGNILLPP